MIDALWARLSDRAEFLKQIQMQRSIIIHLAVATPLQQRSSNHHQNTPDPSLPAHISYILLEPLLISARASGTLGSNAVAYAVLGDLYLHGFWANQQKALINLLLLRKLDHAIVLVFWVRTLRDRSLPKWGDWGKKRHKAASWWPKSHVWHLIYLPEGTEHLDYSTKWHFMKTPMPGENTAAPLWGSILLYKKKKTFFFFQVSLDQLIDVERPTGQFIARCPLD